MYILCYCNRFNAWDVILQLHSNLVFTVLSRRSKIDPPPPKKDIVIFEGPAQNHPLLLFTSVIFQCLGLGILEDIW